MGTLMGTWKGTLENGWEIWSENACGGMEDGFLSGVVVA
jgi:hypothetical protein